MATHQPPRLPAGERLRRAGIGAWSIIGLLILGYAAFWLLLRIRVIFPPLVLALLIIYLLNPIVTFLQRRGVPRIIGAIATYVVVLGTLSLLIVALIPLVADQVDTFRRDWPEIRANIVSFAEDRAATIRDVTGASIDLDPVECLLGADETGIANVPTEVRCDEVTNRLREQVAEQAGRLTEFGGTVIEALLVFILAPLIALYLLIDLPHLGRDLLRMVPDAHREEAVELGGKVSAAVGGFFRGQLLVALIVGVLSSIGFRIIGLPFWLVIGAIAGFFNLIPLVGPFIGGTIGFLVGTFTGDITLGLWAAGVELAVQQLDNHFISPNVMKRAVNLHPVTVMLSLLAGGTVAGFWGVLLGVPAVAVVKLLFGHVWSTRVLGEEAGPEGRPAGPEPPSVVPEDEGPSAEAAQEMERVERESAEEPSVVPDELKGSPSKPRPSASS